MESFKYKGTPEQMQKVAEWALANGYQWYDDDREGEYLYAGTDGDIFYTPLAPGVADLVMTPELELAIFGKTESITGKVEHPWEVNTGKEPDGVCAKIDVKFADGGGDTGYVQDYWWKCDIEQCITHWRLHKADEDYFKQPETTTGFFLQPPQFGEVFNMDAPKRNKYMREIKPGVWVDVYDVLRAFVVTDSALAHLVKKALAVGQRGHKDAMEDYKDIFDSSKRALDIYGEWNK